MKACTKFAAWDHAYCTPVYNIEIDGHHAGTLTRPVPRYRNLWEAEISETRDTLAPNTHVFVCSDEAKARRTACRIARRESVHAG